MTDTYTPVLTLENIVGILHNTPLAPKEDHHVAFARAIERAAIEVYQRQQWISVEDRLPPAETDVLVKVSSKQGSHGFDVAGIFHERWMSQATEERVRWPVTHWMLLPPAPDLPTSTVDNPLENPMTDQRQPGVARVCDKQIKERS